MRKIWLFILVLIIPSAFSIEGDNEKNILAKDAWEKIYKEWFGLEKDFSNVYIPLDYNPGEHFIVIVSKGTSLAEIIAGLTKKYIQVEVTADTSCLLEDRTSGGPDYAVLFDRNNEDLEGFSADSLRSLSHRGITLAERLLLEIFCIVESGQNLESDSWTMCSGTRYLDGAVPDVGWYLNGVYVGWYPPNKSYKGLRSREAIF